MLGVFATDVDAVLSRILATTFPWLSWAATISRALAIAWPAAEAGLSTSLGAEGATAGVKTGAAAGFATVASGCAFDFGRFR